jgi:hypothetical protein
MVRQKLRHATDVTLMNEAGTARAQMALGLAGLVAQVVPATGGIAFEAIRSFAKALCRSAAGFQFRHVDSITFM